MFKLKKNADGTISRFKARLVIRGYLQEHGVDNDDTFSSVVRYESIRILLCIAASEGFYMEQFDVKTAFLHGTLKEEIFIKIPKGYAVHGYNKVLKLLKSIYGLKQSPRCWLETFSTYLNSQVKSSSGISQIPMKSTATPHDPCVFVGVFSGSKIMVAVYVDDGLVMSPTKSSVIEFLDNMCNTFEITRSPHTWD